MEYESAGAIIRRGRTDLGLTQADLAAAVQVNQQSVSRWESGSSRPRRPMAVRLAEFLQLGDPDAFLAACGHELSTAAVSRPTRPLLPRLPLASISPADFENFCRDLLKLRHEGATVNRFGSEGHTQEGVDLIARMPDGTAITYQCKRVRQFGAAKVQKVIESNSLAADRHFLLLSRVASPGARKEIQRHSDWDLLDAEDVSSIVRLELAFDDARRLVDTYFPGWREDFLGLSEAGLWLTPDEFFRPSMKSNAVLSHQWDLVGREAELHAFQDYLESPDRCLLVVGRGGSGKSRLLRACVDHLLSEKPQTKVRFAAREGSFQPRDLETLPGGSLIVVDDAHDRDDVAALLFGLGRRDDIKVVLSARPYASNKLEQDLRNAGLVTLDGVRRLELSEMGRESLELLAAQVLQRGGAPTASAKLIVDATLDSPLFTVIGARLVCEGKASPHSLKSDETARCFLLASFRDAIVGEIGEPGDRELLRELLRLVAILQPISVGDGAFSDAAASVLGHHADILIRHLRTLEEAGVLIRRGRMLRVVPDLLADFLVADACIDPQSGLPTGYADRVFAATSGDIAQHLIINVAKVDWQITREHDVRSPVLNRIWSSLTEELLGVDAFQRVNLLDALSDISFFQPERSLRLVRQLLDHPVDIPEQNDVLGNFTNDHVLDAIPRFIKGAGYHADLLPDVADVLWMLGRQRPGRLHSQPYHPIRVLRELAEFQPQKPIVYSEAIASRAIAWLRDPNVGDYAHSPFDVLESVLATEGYQTRTIGWTLRMEPYLIKADAVTSLRHRVLDIAIETLEHPDLRVAARAAAFLEEGLRYPMGMFGQPVSETVRQSWRPEILRLLDLIADAMKVRSLDPIVKDRILRGVSWHARFGHGQERQVAISITASAGSDLPMRLTRALRHGWAHSARLPEEDDLDYAALEEKWREWQREVARDLISDRTPATVAAVVDQVEERLESLASVSDTDSNPGPFLNVLFIQSPEVAGHCLTRISANPQTPLARQMHLALGALRTSDSVKALQIAEDLLKMSSDLAPGIAAAYSWAARAAPLSPGELDLLRTLSLHDDPRTRLNVAQGLRFATSLQPALRIELLLNTASNGVLEILKEVVSCFGPHGDFGVQDLSPGQQAHLLARLSDCPEIDDYQIGIFLGTLSVMNPSSVMDFLLKRVDTAATASQRNQKFTPIPYLWDESSPLRFRESADFEGILRRLCEWAVEEAGQARRGFWTPTLFAAVAGRFDEAVLRVMEDWLLSQDSERIEAAVDLLRDAPSSLVWDNVSWVRRVLEHAESVNWESYSAVASALHAAVVSGTKTGTPGEPFPQDIEQRDRANEVATDLPIGSAAHRFFVALKKSAESSIRWSLERDEEDRPR